MKPFFLMLGFFTRLPVPKVEFTEERFRKAMLLAPLSGLVIGVILVLVSWLFFRINTTDIVRGAALTCLYIALTGGLHFDGLADTFDGVFSGRSREQSLEIMKDSRIGVFGMLGLFMTGLLYFVLFTSSPPAAVLVFPIAGRACCLFSASLAPYAREEGMGKAAAAGGGPASISVILVSLLGGSLLVSIPLLRGLAGYAGRYALLSQATDSILLPRICSLAAAGAALLLTWLMTGRIRKKLGGVTGDTLGAVIEVSSIAYLLVFTLLYPILPL